MNENTKVTLTLGQLKRLVKEAKLNKRDVREARSSEVFLDIPHDRDDLGWTKGTAELDGQVFDVELKYFDTPSRFGIDGGNISKLWVSDGNEDVINYDRGWDVRPRDPVTRAILRAIIKEFAV